MAKTITTTTTITTVTTHDDMPTPPPAQPGLRPLVTQYFRMVQPLIGRGVLLRNYAAGAGVITVSVRRVHPDAVRFYCKVSAALAPALTLPDKIDYSQPDPADLVRLTRVGTTEYFTASTVAVAGVPAAIPTDPNQQIIVGAYNVDGQQRLEVQNFGFIAIPQIPLSVRVNAKGCLFFAYAGAIPGAILPHAPQEKLPDNLPTFVVAPIDGAGVTVSVPKKDDGTDQQWTNEHDLVNANGQAGDNDTTVDAYRSSYLGSQYMKRLGKETPAGQYLDGLLTGMWDFGRENSADPLACVQLKIGVGPTPLGVPNIASPTDATAEPLAPLFLLLGLHMDDNWNQSADKPSGYLNVTLSWV